MSEIIDLSQEIYANMPVHKTAPPVKLEVHVTHEQWAKEKNPKSQTPAMLNIEMGEHTGTHVDALSHMRREDKDKSIDKMPLTNFYTSGICLDLSHKEFNELIEITDLQKAVEKAELTITSQDTVLLYTDHYRKAYGTVNWTKGPGLSAAAARWLGEQKIPAFGVETVAPGVSGVSNKDVHRVCGEMGFTHYENLINLHLLIGRGRFKFIGLPLKIRGGTGSPVRAIAVFD